jgi:glycosyltransferase involved in cell wall biosynthesis
MARFLPETMDSVLSQDYPDIEYTVMDGGSMDETVEILHDY